MSSLQYKLVVENGEVVSTEGSFFPGAGFDIIMGDVTVSAQFKRNENHHVTYLLSENGTPLIELDHPDYTPDCDPSEIDAHLNPSNGQGLLLVDAFLKVGVGKGKPYSELDSKFSYEVVQKPLFS